MFDQTRRDCRVSPCLTRAHWVCRTLVKAQKRSSDEPREEMQKKRKVSEAEEEEEKDEQRFVFKVLKALITPGLKVFCAFGQ